MAAQLHPLASTLQLWVCQTSRVPTAAEATP